jgi:hypothetical protein
MLSRGELGLTAAQDDLFYEALKSSHRIRILVRIHDRNERVISEIRPDILSGSVQFDAEADVTRSLSLEILDPKHQLEFDSTNPGAGALFADNFISVRYGVFVETIGTGTWVDVPVFFGILTLFSRKGPIVTVEAQGKETLGLDPHFVTRQYMLADNQLVRDAIEKVMRQLGERKFKLGMITGKLQKKRSVIPGEQPWRVCTGGDKDSSGEEKPSLMSKSAKTSDVAATWYLFYDGTGTLTAKSKNAPAIFTFKHDEHLVSQPGYDYDVLAFRNHAEVLGGKGKNATRRARGEYSLPAAHPLSPSSLARNGDGRFLSIFIEAEGLKSDSECKQRAKRAVEANDTEGVSANFESLPIPTLEENDKITLDMGEYILSFKLKQFTLPLTVDGTMSIGFSKQIKPKRRRHF